jgi:hypothetical protein
MRGDATGVAVGVVRAMDRLTLIAISASRET